MMQATKHTEETSGLRTARKAGWKADGGDLVRDSEDVPQAIRTRRPEGEASARHPRLHGVDGSLQRPRNLRVGRHCEGRSLWRRPNPCKSWRLQTRSLYSAPRQRPFHSLMMCQVPCAACSPRETGEDASGGGANLKVEKMVEIASAAASPNSVSHTAQLYGDRFLVTACRQSADHSVEWGG